MKAPFNVLIIGAGKIGAFFDKPSSKNILTHAHAFTSIKNFHLLGFVNRNPEKAKHAAAVWKSKVFSSIKQAFDTENIDVVCIATPDETHYDILQQISNYKMRLVFLEKPIATNIDQADTIRQIFKRKQIPILLNYSRRFVPEFEKVRLDIQNGNYGKYITGTGYYGKGVLHNGSHVIDLLCFLLGDIEHTHTISSSFDYSAEDPSMSVILTLNNKKQFFLQNVDHRLYTIFEIDLLFEKRRIRIIDSGFTIEDYTIEESRIFHRYKTITSKKLIRTHLGTSMYYAAKNILSYLRGTERLLSPINEAYKTMQICNSIIKKT